MMPSTVASVTDDLAARLARDLDSAFEDFVTAYRTPVYSGLRRLHPADAEDLTQEAFIRAYRALSSYPVERIEAIDLRPWLWTIALNLGRNHARDRARRPQPAELHDRHQAPQEEPADSRAWDERLASLPPRQRKAVVLRHVVGLTYEELALALERPVGTVKNDVHRGLGRLRTIIEEEA